jgi:pimeloyl-ACP methyl ester carboxylesterase
MKKTVFVDGTRVAVEDLGEGDSIVVLLHAFLMTHHMQLPLAQHLASEGRRVLCVDLLGELDPGQAPDPARYSSQRLAAQVLGVLDELGVDKAVVGGTSIGSNVAMEMALAAPERVQGLIIEGPFLEGGVRATAFAWSSMLSMFTLGAPVVRLMGRLASRLPDRGLPGMLRAITAQDPARSAAFVAGLTYGSVGPARDRREQIDTPALIIGFPGDPLHPMSDAEALRSQLKNAAFARGRSILDLRIRPDALAAQISRSLESWDAERSAAERAAAAS